jgi:hypothetical protein
MNILQYLISLFRPPNTISTFQKQSRLWFVLRGQIHISQAEKDTKFFQVCKESFGRKKKEINFNPSPNYKELYCEHCGCFVFHHSKCFSWIGMKRGTDYVYVSNVSDRSLAKKLGYLYLQGDDIQQRNLRQ